jgi:hypothetical protein
MEEVGQIIFPKYITTEMILLAKNADPWHFAANLNSYLQNGYCRKCGLTPDGCEREGCRALQHLQQKEKM